MRKWLIVLTSLTMLLSGCGQSTQSVQPSEPEKGTAVSVPMGDHVDLTVMSSTMVYAEVYNMMANPDDYIGKTVKMKGVFGIGKLYNPAGSSGEDEMLFSCVVKDVSSCCAQGIPFDLAGEYTYPQDYPEVDTEITVSGTFEIHQDDGLRYLRIANASLTVDLV